VQPDVGPPCVDGVDGNFVYDGGSGVNVAAAAFGEFGGERLSGDAVAAVVDGGELTSGHGLFVHDVPAFDWVRIDDGGQPGFSEAQHPSLGFAAP